MDEAKRTSFDRIPAQYHKARPGYPDDLIEFLLSKINSEPVKLLEVGAGTGKATELFLAKGCHVTAIEPGENLADELKKNNPGTTELKVVVSKFEEYEVQPAEYDLVLAAQSFHWVEPEIGLKKAAQALKPAGLFAIIGNFRRVEAEEPEFRDQLNQIYSELFPPDDGVPFHVKNEQLIQKDLNNMKQCGLFSEVQQHSFNWEQEYTARQYCELLDTYSENLIIEDDLRQEFYGRVAGLIEEFGGIYRVPYRAVLRVGVKPQST